jgi:hypothetical protein
MIEAYLDETGIHDGAPFCVIAGYFGGPGQWTKFDCAWRRALSAFGVPLDQFHALDLMRRRKFFFDWDGNRKSELLARLAAAITRYRIYPVSVGLIVADFQELSLTQRRFFTGATMLNGQLVTSGCPNKPYFAPFQHCVKRVVSYAEVGGTANFFLGLDRPFAKYARTLYDIIKRLRQPDETRCRLGKIDFPLAKETSGLQAADLLAYLTASHMQEHPSGPAHPGPLLHSVLGRNRMLEDHGFFNRETMRAHIAEVLDIAPVLAFEREDEEDLL